MYVRKSRPTLSVFTCLPIKKNKRRRCKNDSSAKNGNRVRELVAKWRRGWPPNAICGRKVRPKNETFPNCPVEHDREHETFRILEARSASTASRDHFCDQRARDVFRSGDQPSREYETNRPMDPAGRGGNRPSTPILEKGGTRTIVYIC